MIDMADAAMDVICLSTFEQRTVTVRVLSPEANNITGAPDIRCRDIRCVTNQFGDEAVDSFIIKNGRHRPFFTKGRTPVRRDLLPNQSEASRCLAVPFEGKI